ncbi:Short-chain dehydrogenase/reductase SDR [Penicillium capsulatum]|uniref:Short-chain dehydrogenase/reductase SDR n=1 Tax=Penicillium capsulatum TaxID=69766 RepID=A0A9W9IEI7_9EURO|nr:Short-chain dehydrogenase/reductase SDR [Penicillium capsulatum]
METSAPKPQTTSFSWSHYLNLDTLASTLDHTLLNPGLAWMLVLCLRAQVTPTTDRAWIITVTYAVALTILFVLRVMNRRIAHGFPRTVDSAREVVLVTGGASGLGLVIAQMYAMRGVSVAVLDIRDLESEEDQLLFQGCAEYYQCDVGDRAQLEAVKGRIEKELGTPTIIMNCAAARINGQSLLNLSADAFEKTVRTNLLAAFHLYQVFLPGIVADSKNGGTIVTVSSVLGQLSPAGLGDYSASKAGLSALHRTLEAEVRDNEHIKTLLVEIGQMSTPLFDWVRTPSHFFAPVLEPVQVAREIVAAVDGGRGGVLRLPTFAKLVNWYAVFPAAVQVVARYLSGIDGAVSSGISSRDGSDEQAQGIKERTE